MSLSVSIDGVSKEKKKTRLRQMRTRICAHRCLSSFGRTFVYWGVEIEQVPHADCANDSSIRLDQWLTDFLVTQGQWKTTDLLPLNVPCPMARALLDMCMQDERDK